MSEQRVGDGTAGDGARQSPAARTEPSSSARQAWGGNGVPSGVEETTARSHFEAFHRSQTRFDYPPRKDGTIRGALGAAGVFLLMLASALAIAVWMDPGLMPRGTALLKTAGAAIGLRYPANFAKQADARFGISPGELPYDGNTVPDTAGGPTSPSEAASSSGNSATQDVAVSAPPTETISALVGDAAVPAEREEAAPTPAPAPARKPASSAKPHPKSAAVSASARKKEIGRLRRQAEDELYAE